MTQQLWFCGGVISTTIGLIWAVKIAATPSRYYLTSFTIVMLIISCACWFIWLLDQRALNDWAGKLFMAIFGNLTIYLLVYFISYRKYHRRNRT